MMPNFGMQPQIILLKEGTDTSQGKPQLISNINACMAVVDTVRTTLGPRGMDKLIHNDRVGGQLVAAVNWGAAAFGLQGQTGLFPHGSSAILFKRSF